MPKTKLVEFSDKDMFAMVKRVAQVGITIFETSQLNEYFRRKLVTSMKDANFAQALPHAYVEELDLFFKQAISEGADQVLVSLLLNGGGLGVFMYELSLTPHGLDCSPALEYFTPKKSGDRRIPRSFSGLPHMALDVSTMS